MELCVFFVDLCVMLLTFDWRKQRDACNANQTMISFNKNILHRSGRESGSFTRSAIVLCSALLFLHFDALWAQVVSNNGAFLSLTSGVVLVTKDVLNGSGTITNAGTIELTGDWTNNGTLTAGAGTVTFKGTSAQNINGSAGTQPFFNVGISNTSGVTLGGSSAFSVDGSLSMITGTNLHLPLGPALTIASGATVSTPGTGKISLDSGASYINLSSSAPMIQIQTTITGGAGWRMLAAPDSVTVASLFAGNFVTQGFTGSTIPALQPNLLWWNTDSIGTSSQAWRQPATSSDLVKFGRGYMYYVFNGTLRPDAGSYPDVLPLTMTALGTEKPLSPTFDFGVTATSPSVYGSAYVDTNYMDYGWNLVGNPTPSTIDWNASSGWTRTNIDSTIYIWDPSAGGSYKTWNGTTGNLGNGKIAPFQAFWVKANAASPHLKAANGVKSTGGAFLGKISAGLGKSASTADSTSKKDTSIARSTSVSGGASLKKDTSSTVSTPVLGLELSANGIQIQAYLMFSQDGKLTYDPHDAFSLVPLSDKYLILYSVAGQGQPAMQIQNLPDTGFGQPFSLPLYLGGTNSGKPLSASFTLKWKLDGQLPSNWTVTLMDDAAGKSYTLSKPGQITFNFDTPADLVPSGSSFLQKKSGVASNQGLVPALPQPVVFTVPATKLAKGAAASRFRLVVSANNDVNGYLPSTPELAQNYPNPFNPSTNIQFAVPSRSRVVIQIFNILGQKCLTLTDQEYAAGKHVVVWNATGASSGVYFCRMIVGKNTQIKKMVLLR